MNENRISGAENNYPLPPPDSALPRHAEALRACGENDMGQILTKVTLMRTILGPFSKWGQQITDTFGLPEGKDPIKLRDRVLEIVGDYLQTDGGERLRDAMEGEQVRREKYFDDQNK